MKTRVIRVDKLNYSRFMNDKAKSVVDQFNQMSADILYLLVYPSHQESPLEHILEEGMYEYATPDDDEFGVTLVTMLDELVNAASPVMFNTEDVTVLC